MKTLAIHPKDPTTDFLSEIYSGKDWTVITESISKKSLKENIKSHDRIAMLGHGTERGLLGFDRFVIDSTMACLLREKICVSIWCNADAFAKKYGLKGFYTGMIISDIDEAYTFGVKASYDLLQESNKRFAFAIKESIDSDDMLEKAISLYEGDSQVILFNRNSLYCSK